MWRFLRQEASSEPRHATQDTNPGGAGLWYDFRGNRARVPHLSGIRARPNRFQSAKSAVAKQPPLRRGVCLWTVMWTFLFAAPPVRCGRPSRDHVSEIFGEQAISRLGCAEPVDLFPIFKFREGLLLPMPPGPIKLALRSGPHSAETVWHRLKGARPVNLTF